MRRWVVSGASRRPLGRSMSAVLLLGIVLVVAAAPSMLRATRAAPVGPMSGAGILLNANPSRGVAPLLVDFSLTTPNGTSPPRYEWTFGDGTYLNGSGASFGSPSHTYLTPGVFDAVATAVWSAGPENASVTIQVLSSVLSVQLAASPLNGTAPLTVTFNATPSGGSGTYLSYLWTFGDGGVGSGLDVRYTYVAAGTYEAGIAVTDSIGGRARADVNVTVRPSTPNDSGNNSSNGNGTSTGSRTGGSQGLLSYLPEIAVSLLGIGVAVFVVSVAWVLRQRRSVPLATSRSPSPTETVSPPPAGPGPPPTSDPGAPAEATPVPATPALPPPDPSGLAASRRLALQLLRCMATLPKVPPGGLAGPEWTQAGLAGRAGAGQSAISRVLRRLAAAGIVESETTHVAGGARRVRVYRLSPRGERLARALLDPGASGASPELSDAELRR